MTDLSPANSPQSHDAATSLRDVWSDNEERPKPHVERLCSVCFGGREVYGCDGVVSQAGVEHIGMVGGSTYCGRDATGPKWWWPL